MTAYRIEEIMRKDVQALSSDTPIRRAVALLVEARAAAAPVIDDGRVKGFLTQKDCFRPALHASYYREWTGRVADYMSGDVVSVDAQDDVMRVAEKFVSYPHRIFPVMDGERCVGLIHRSDVLSFLSRIG